MHPFFEFFLLLYVLTKSQLSNMSQEKRARIEEEDDETVFMPGTYYVGDLRYVFSRENWRRATDLVQSNKWKSDFYKVGDIPFYYLKTAHGDGFYKDEQGRGYPVDSGSIGCVHVKHVDEDLKPKGEEPCGHLIEFTKPFTCREEYGTMYFGKKIVINTDPADEDEEESEEDEEESEEDEEESEEESEE
jgi:hypothetical protein